MCHETATYYVSNSMTICHNAAHKETSALLRSTQNIVRRKHHVPVHGVPSATIIVSNYVRYDIYVTTNMEQFFQNKSPLNNHIRISIRVALCMPSVIWPVESCHLQVTMVIDIRPGL